MVFMSSTASPLLPVSMLFSDSGCAPNMKGRGGTPLAMSLSVFELTSFAAWGLFGSPLQIEEAQGFFFSSVLCMHSNLSFLEYAKRVYMVNSVAPWPDADLAPNRSQSGPAQRFQTLESSPREPSMSRTVCLWITTGVIEAGQVPSVGGWILRALADLMYQSWWGSGISSNLYSVWILPCPHLEKNVLGSSGLMSVFLESSTM
mmetsp:Transcript_113072/g.320294  ORF Transcript_113072/g.320294 Transcript_113072/m.320294 type:complete len:203 (+) Transcript_113072:82-690(+)